jgi:hypothetical protein
MHRLVTGPMCPRKCCPGSDRSNRPSSASPVITEYGPRPACRQLLLPLLFAFAAATAAAVRPGVWSLAVAWSSESVGPSMSSKRLSARPMSLAVIPASAAAADASAGSRSVEPSVERRACHSRTTLSLLPAQQHQQQLRRAHWQRVTNGYIPCVLCSSVNCVRSRRTHKAAGAWHLRCSWQQHIHEVTSCWLSTAGVL